MSPASAQTRTNNPGISAPWSQTGLKLAGNSFVGLDGHGQGYYKSKVSFPSTEHNDPGQGSKQKQLIGSTNIPPTSTDRMKRKSASTNIEDTVCDPDF